MAEPRVGEDGLVFEDRPLSMSVLQALPTEVGLWKSQVVYSSIEANDSYLVVGSEQGVVWVIDLETANLLREFSEFRGVTITVLKLSPTRDLLAYGTSDGHVKIEKIVRPMSNKWHIQEKANQAVRALEWNGDNLFCGFDLGRVVRMQVNIHEGTLSPLTFSGNYGSTVTQLSCKENTLLVSTVERTWMVDTETHKLEQVGRKDRKPGQYGGCLIQGGEKAYVARPGLRLWSADNTGKVLSTVVFKEALSTRHLPRVPLHSWPSIVPTYNKVWQFSSVRPWVGEHFIVTLSDHTLFVLHPENGETVGVLTLGHQITDSAVTRGFVYILCRDMKKPICRISVKQSFLRALKKTLPAYSPLPSKKLLSVGKPTVDTNSDTLNVPSESAPGRQNGEVPTEENRNDSGRNTKKDSSLDNAPHDSVDGRSHDLHVTRDKLTEEHRDETTLAPADESAIASNSMCSYVDEDTKTLDEVPQDEGGDTNYDLRPHTATNHSDLNSDLQSHTVANHSNLNYDLQSAETSSGRVEVCPSTDSNTGEGATPLAEPAGGALLADTVPSSGTEGSKSSVEDPTKPKLNIDSESVSAESSVRSESVLEEPEDSIVEKPNLSDSASCSKGDKHDSESSKPTVQSEKVAEPTLQEALQNVKAEMKELKEFLKPGFDKLSNIFKGANPGGLSPNRIRVLASRRKGGEDKSDPESHDLSVVIEENKSKDSPSKILKEDQEQSKRADLKEKLKLGFGNLLNKDAPGSVQTPDDAPLPATPLDPEELERREKMSQSRPEIEDDVVVIKKDKKKKRKKRFTKKVSSATSSVSVSLEKLTEIEEENDDSPTTLSSLTTPLPLSRTTSPCVPFTLTEEQTSTLERLKVERNTDESNEREQSIPETLSEKDTAETGETVTTPIVPPTDIDEQMATPTDVNKQLAPPTGVDKQEAPPTDVEEQVTTPTNVTVPVISPLTDEREPSATEDKELEERGKPQSVAEETDTLMVDTGSRVAQTESTPSTETELPSSTQPGKDVHISELKVDADYIPLFEDTDTPPELLFANNLIPEVSLSKSTSPGLLDSRGESHEKSMTTTLGDLSDNPLYHDSDIEHEHQPTVPASSLFSTSPKKSESCVDSRSRSTLTRIRPSQLEPGEFDPLQSDDSYEGLFGTKKKDKLVNSIPVTLRSRVGPDVWEKQQARGRPTGVVSGSWTPGYDAPRGSSELSAEPSDSSHDEEEEEQEVEDSLVVPDFYKLCGSLVRHSNTRTQESKVTATAGTRKLSWAAPEYPRESIIEPEEELSGEGPASNADIWVPIPHPGRSHLQCISLSDTLLWVIDGRGSVFCTSMDSKGRDWQLIKPSMAQVCSSPSGKIVWGVHHHNAYVRLGIGLNMAGSTWKNTTKGTSMSRKIKRLSVSENAVWALTTDNRTVFRRGVDETTPDGRVWQEIKGEGFCHISCSKNVVWAHTSQGKVFIRDGITPSTPSGRKWSECKCPKLTASCLTAAGVAWGINSEGSIGFRCGVTPQKPSGQGAWWEVKINALTHPSSPYNSLWQVMGSEGSHLLTSVLPHLTQHTKQLVLSASSKSGVIILQDSNRLHACWRTATGYHYRPASKNGLFPLTIWSKIAAGHTGFWLVREDGDLHCLTASDKLKRIECPAAIQHLAASTTCLWIVSDNLVWSRQGLSQDLPEGVSFDYIEVSPQLHDRKIRCISCGNSAVWALDQTGVPHFRFGVHSREPGTGMSPAWIPVEDIPGPLLQISVCDDNWLVWACDEKFNSYVRTGVTHDFPIGRKWEHVPGEQLKEVSVTNEYVYGLTPSGELLCRYGISEENVQGNYWRRMPGRYEHLAVGKFGELWTLDAKGQVWKQEWKVLAVSQDPQAGQDDFETSMVVDQSWEVV